MSIITNLLSVALSCSIGYWSFASLYPAATAANDFDKSVCLYNNINSTESKDPVSDEEPFHVFEIYDAFLGVTTSTTTTTTSAETTTTVNSETNAVKTTKVTTNAIKTTSPEKTTTNKIQTTTSKNTTTKTTSPEKTTTTKIQTTTSKNTTTKTTLSEKTTTTKIQTTASKTTSSSTKTTASTKKTTTIPTTTMSTVNSTDSPTSATTSSISPNFPNGLYLRGIDVSEHQGEINWKSVKESGLADFAIIRAGYGKELYQVDKFFHYNMQNAQANGIDVGIYWYSYASTPEGALMEAETCYEIIKDYSFTYPIYYDVEEPKIVNNLTTAEVSAIFDTFCSFFEEKGYYVGAYSYANLLQTKVYRSVLEKYDVWAAQYSSQLSAYDGHYGIWQYGSDGAVDGINGNVDMNYCYKDYPSIIGKNPSTGGDRPNIPAITTQTDSPNEPLQTTTTASFIVSSQSCGIDISAENGDIDWNSAASSGAFSFIMLKAGEGGTEPQEDEYFDKNFDAAKGAGIPCGVYWKAKSTTVEGIHAEAVKFYEIVKGRQFEYPMFLDLTDESITQSGLNESQLWELIDNFCLYLENRDCYIGIRGSEQFLQDSVNAELFKKYDVWLYSDIPFTPTFEYEYGMMSIGGINVSGVNGKIIANSANKEYAMIMKKNHLNGF